MASILLTISVIVCAGIFASSSDKKPSEANTPMVSEPVITYSDSVETIPVDFQEKNQDDSTLEKGSTKTIQEGTVGEKQIIYKIKYVDGKEVSREKVSEIIAKEPVDKIVAVGTKVQSSSNTNNSQSTTGGGYINVDGNYVPSPSTNPEGATAKCRDGTYSYSQNHRGTCSHHGGVEEWLD